MPILLFSPRLPHYQLSCRVIIIIASALPTLVGATMSDGAAGSKNRRNNRCGTDERRSARGKTNRSSGSIVGRHAVSHARDGSGFYVGGRSGYDDDSQ